jgi:hypothetical protein
MVWSVTSNDEESAILEILETNSPRIVAIVGSAILEQRLEQSLRLRLRRGDTVEKLFNPGRGALGTFVVKIDLGYVLRMYEKDEHTALTGIAEIRNLFAHRLGMSFSEESVQKSIGKLKLHTKRSHYPAPLWDSDTDIEIDPPKDDLALFLVNLRIALALLTRDRLRHQSWSNEPTNRTFSPPVEIPF